MIQFCSKRTEGVTRCVVITALVYCLFGCASGVWGTLLAPLATFFHVSLDAAGLLYVAWSLGTLPGTLLGGMLLDRWGPKCILQRATLLTAGGLFGLYVDMFFVPPSCYILAFCCCVVIGIGSGSIDAAANGFVSSCFSSRRGSALTLFSLLNPLSIALVALLNAALLVHFHNDPRPCLGFLLLCSLVALCTLPFFSHSRSSTPGEKTHPVRRVRPSRVQKRATWGGVLILLVVAGINAFLRLWGPTYLHLAFAQPLSTAATESGFIAALGIVGCLVSATLLLRFHAKQMLTFCFALALMGLLVLVIHPPVFIALLALGAIGAALNATFGPLVALVNMHESTSSGSRISVLLFSGLLSASLIPPFGFLLTHVGFQSVLVLLLGLLVGAFFVLPLCSGDALFAWRMHRWKGISVRTTTMLCAGVTLMLGGTYVVRGHMALLQPLFSPRTLFVSVLFCVGIGFVGIGAVVGVSVYIVHTLTRPKRGDQFIPLTPFALGLPAEEVVFACQGEAHSVRGLYIPAPGATSTILVCPGYRRSFSDVLGMCRHLWDAGHTVLAFEYYGHGIPVGARVTLGYREVDDFLGAVAYARFRAPTARLGALGYSMGAAVSLIGSARTQAVEAVVADSAFSTQWNAVYMAVRRTVGFPLPAWSLRLLYAVTDTLLHWSAGYRFHQVEPVREIARIAPRPILLIHGVLDTIVDVRDATVLYDAAAHPKELWLIPETEHIRGYFADSVKYTQRVIAFFEMHLKGQPCANTPAYAFPGIHQRLNPSLALTCTKQPSRSNTVLLQDKGQRIMHQSATFGQDDISPTLRRKEQADVIRERRFTRLSRLRYTKRSARTPHTLHRVGRLYGNVLFRSRWFILGGWLLIFALSLPFANSLTTLLHNSGYTLHGSDSDHANALLTDTLHQPVSQVLVLFHSDALSVQASPYQEDLQQCLLRLHAFPHVVSATVGGIGRDGKTTFITVGFDTNQDIVAQHLAQLRSLLPQRGGDSVHATLTGEPEITNEIQLATQTDSEHAELLALPLTLLVLLFVFGTVVAGLLPLLLAAVTVPVTLALVYLFALHVETNIFVVNVVSLIGLGLSIDYSLFLVRRFREELAQGRTVREAISQTIATAGEAVLFSGLIVMIGFSGLFFVGIPVMTSFALGGVTVAGTAVLAAITLLPALLCIVGERINALRLPMFRRTPHLKTALVKRQAPLLPGQQHFWYRWAMVVMQRPVLMTIGVLFLLLALGWPALSLSPGLPGASALPAHSEARVALDQLKRQFPDVDVDPLFVLVQTQDGTNMLSSQNMDHLQLLTQRIASLAHIRETMSIVEVPKTGIGQQQLFHLYSTGAYRKVPALAHLVAATTTGGTTLITVHTDGALSSQEDQTLLAQIRSLGQTQDGRFHVLVGGSRAVNGDFDRVLYGNFFRALLFIVVATYVLLLVMFRSVILPLKAILMNMLSIGAAYGVLVFVFQQGHFQDALHFTSDGSIDRFIPVLLFCVLFGLSMDYEVFLLSRIKEEWQRTRDNSVAVAYGLQHTGGVITNAALLFMIVAASFITTSLIVTKELGFGISVAIFVDATLIRTVLVPATMQLLGRTNWWFPRRRKQKHMEKTREWVDTGVQKQDESVFVTRATKNLSREKKQSLVTNEETFINKGQGLEEDTLCIQEQPPVLVPALWSWPTPSGVASTQPYFYPSFSAPPHVQHVAREECEVHSQRSAKK